MTQTRRRDLRPPRQPEPWLRWLTLTVLVLAGGLIGWGLRALVEQSW